MTAVPSDIEGLSFKQLTALEAKIAGLKTKRYDEAQVEAQTKLASLLAKMALEAGVKPSQLAIVSPPNGAHKGKGKRGGKVAVKFRDPSDPTHTWTGRGRAPRWLSTLEAKGKRRDDYRVLA